MRRANIQAVFWDFGNVCATFDMKRFTTPFSQHLQVDSAEVGAVLFGHMGYSPLFRSLECGTVSPCQFYHKLTSALGKADAIDYETFARMWSDIFLRENTELCDVLDRIPHCHYLLSNTNEIVRSRYMANSAIVRKHFRAPCAQILSHRVGAMKPDERIYREALRSAGIPASQCLFVDDLPENILAWKALGGHGVVYNAKHDSIDDLEHKLAYAGALRI